MSTKVKRKNPGQSERMRRNNPMARPEVRAKFRERMKENNPMKRLDVRAKVTGCKRPSMIGDKNPMFGKKRLEMSGENHPFFGKKNIGQIEWMKNGGAAHANSFVKNPSKPQVQLYEKVKIFYPCAILNYPCLNYSIDTAIVELKIAIEYDGSYYHKDEEYHCKRQKEIEKEGWKFLRYRDYVPDKDQLCKDLSVIIGNN